MPVRLRFSLHGTRRNRICHLVAVEQGARRDAKPTELLGIYNRYPAKGEAQKTVEWSVDRIRYWLNVGAVPTKSVAKLLELGNILKPTSPYHSTYAEASAAQSPPSLQLESEPSLSTPTEAGTTLETTTETTVPEVPSPESAPETTP
ncbi:hypothetical protein DXG03_009001 [Asterophora parasitica]|uniref:Ribosomal protein S16 n=1 Tax=Asterophora parasitica TaxID=117018 RepID=A0A9P7GCQ7_9AGAR|nr:hypothetical protein DXG03_009001 [Asterophora parasitica]